MMKKNFILIIFVVASALVARGAKVTVAQPGTLADKLGVEAEWVTSLEVNGPIDATDLMFAAQQMSSLRTLDLTNAVIEACDRIDAPKSATSAAATIPAGTFAGSPITSVLLPKQAGLVIGEGAFLGSKLTKITFPANVARTGVSAFAGCEDLLSVVIEGQIEVSEYSFADCEQLLSVSNSELITTIGAGAFTRCKNLGYITFGPNLTELGERAFEMSGLEIVNLTTASSLHSIGAWAFAGSPRLATVELGSEITSVGRGAFFDCKAMTLFDASQSEFDMPDYALTNARALDCAGVISPAATRLGSYSLKGATALASVCLPGTLTEIGDGAMEGMTALEGIDARMLREVPETGEAVWSGVKQDDVTLFVMPDVARYFEGAPQWCEFRINTSSAVDAAGADASATIEAHFEGATLLVMLTDPDVSTLTVYDIAGRMIASCSTAGEGLYVMATGMPRGIYVVSAWRTDGTVEAIKVARN